MKYRVTKPYAAGSGIVHDKNNTPVIVSAIAPKVGDMVEGAMKTVFLFGKNQKGIEIQVSAPGGTEKAQLFIPETSLEELTPTAIPAMNSATTSSGWMPQANIYTIGGVLAGVGVGYAMYNSQTKRTAIIWVMVYCLIGALSGLAAGQAVSYSVQKLK